MGRTVYSGFKKVPGMINEPGIYIGIGMVLSLFLTETLGVTAGGIIVPGYIAMNLDSPSRLFVTFGISIIVYLIIKLLSNFILVYGKRRLVLGRAASCRSYPSGLYRYFHRLPGGYADW